MSHQNPGRLDKLRKQVSPNFGFTVGGIRKVVNNMNDQLTKLFFSLLFLSF